MSTSRRGSKGSGRDRHRHLDSKVLVPIGLGIVLAAALLAWLVRRPGTEHQPFLSRSEFLFDTLVTIQVPNEEDVPAANTALQRMRQIEEAMSVTIPGSDVSRLNRAAGEHPVELGEDTARVLRAALQVAEASAGAFDPTILPLVRLWSITAGKPRLPTPEQIAEARQLVDYRLLQLEGRRAYLPRPGMGIDLGAIAKGYAADEAAAILAAQGVKSALIDAGGTIRVLDSKRGRWPWRLAIRDPRGPAGSYFALFETRDRSTATSGDYERFFILEGKRYHHIIDPGTGRPAASGLISATIITDGATLADALSTAVFVLGPEKGLGLLRAFPGTEAVLVTEERKVLATEGIRPALKITEDGYSLAPRPD